MDLQLAGNIFGTVYLRGSEFEFFYHETTITAGGAGAASTCTCTCSTTTTTTTTVGNGTIDISDPPTRLDGANWWTFQVHRGGRSNMA